MAAFSLVFGTFTLILNAFLCYFELKNLKIEKENLQKLREQRANRLKQRNLQEQGGNC